MQGCCVAWHLLFIKNYLTMKWKFFSCMLLAVGFVMLSSFVSDDEGEPVDNGGSGWKYRKESAVCPRDQWAMVTTTTYSGSGAKIYVDKGQIIPGTNIIAGVSGYYNTSTAATYANLRESYRDYCVYSGSWFDNCNIVSCRVLFD